MTDFNKKNNEGNNIFIRKWKTLLKELSKNKKPGTEDGETGDRPENYDDDIITRQGCVCKPEFKYLDNIYKKKCATTILSGSKVCYVEGKCGRKDHKDEWWDYCSPEIRSEFAGGDVAVWEHSPIKKLLGSESEVRFSTKYLIRNLLGFGIFIAIFVLLVPYLLSSWGQHELLEVYLPNFDLLATAISYSAGPGESRIFQDLYNPKSSTLMGYWSKLVINYLSLASVAYIVARRTKLTGSVVTGWGLGVVMILLTYLLPNDFISYIQYTVSKFLYDKFHWDSNDGIYGIIKYYLISFLGLAIASIFIFFEKALIAGHEKWLDPIIKELVKINKSLLKLK